MKKKMVIIGAGSAMFTQGLITDLIEKNPGGHEWSIALCDIDEEILKDVTIMVKKMLKLKKLDIEVTASPDRCEVLPGADYVVSTIGVGKRRAWEQDVFIPRKYGIYQPVGDTAMPGGVSRAMRMVPAMVDIVNDTKRLAPKARFFNYSNPMAVICRALNKTVDFPVTGLCIGTAGSEWYIAEQMGYDKSRVSSLAAGINHCTFIYDYRLDGVSVMDDIRKMVSEKYAAKFDSNMIDRYHGQQEGIETDLGEPFAWDFFLRYGAYPAPGDRHITEFFTEYFPNGEYYGKKLGIDAYSFEGTIKWGDEIYERTIELAKSPEDLPEDFFDKFHGEHEQLISIIDSIERDSRKTFYVNMPNQGAVPNLPHWAVIEAPAVATANGLMPIYQNHFPNVLACMTNRFLACVEMIADAALTGDRQLMAEAIMMGGYIQDRDAVKKMVDELIEAQKQYLPQF
ncbi:MAG: hypothetical protein ACOX85_11845 [Candidatus Pararuminococcus gallinarum]|jgi:alpha-galactosidase